MPQKKSQNIEYATAKITLISKTTKKTSKLISHLSLQSYFKLDTINKWRFLLHIIGS